MSNQHPRGATSAMVDPFHDMPRWLEDAWLSRYLERELNAPERAAFEAYCFGRDHLLDRLDADADLRDVLSAHPGAFAEVASSKQATNVRAISRRAPVYFAMAACLVCGVLGGAIATGSRGLDGVVVDPTRIVFDTMRGSDDGISVDHASSASETVLLDIAVPLDAKRLALTVEGQSNRPLTASSDGFVSAILPRELLRSGKAVGVEFQRGDAVVRRRLTLPPQWESP